MLKNASSSSRTAFVALTALALAASFGSRTQAANYYFDPQGATALGGTGPWDTTTPIWSTTTAPTGAPVTYGNALMDAAFFNGTVTATTQAAAFAVTVAGTVNANNVSFQPALGTGANAFFGYTVSGGTINLSGTAPTILSGNAIGNTITSALTGTAGFTFTNNAAGGTGFPLRLQGDLSGLTGTINVGNGNTTTGGGYISVGTSTADFTSGASQTWNIAANGLLIGNNQGTARTYSLGALTGIGVLRSGTTNGGVRTGTDTFQIGALNTDSTFAGTVIANGGSSSAITKVGTGTLTFSGANTYTGATTVTGGILAVDNNNTATARLTATPSITVNTGGTLQFAQSGATASIDRISNTAAVTLGAGATANSGGRFNTGGFNEGPVGGAAGSGAAMGILTPGANSTIDFNTGATAAGSNLLFASLTYTAGTAVNIRNFTGAAGADTGSAANDRLLLITNPNLTNAQLASIQFYNDAGVALPTGATEIAFNGYTELVPVAVPEPATWALMLGLAVIGGRLVRRRRAAQA